MSDRCHCVSCRPFSYIQALFVCGYWNLLCEILGSCLHSPPCCQISKVQFKLIVKQNRAYLPFEHLLWGGALHHNIQRRTSSSLDKTRPASCHRFLNIEQLVTSLDLHFYNTKCTRITAWHYLLRRTRPILLRRAIQDWCIQWISWVSSARCRYLQPYMQANDKRYGHVLWVWHTWRQSTTVILLHILEHLDVIVHIVNVMGQ